MIDEKGGGTGVWESGDVEEAEQEEEAHRAD